jgi:2-iminobutanoate/2-iminopropanoate deaminase
MLGQVASGAEMKQEIRTDRAPEPPGPYAQGSRAGGLVFSSMQLPLDPVTGKVISGDAALRAHQALSNAQGVLEAAGCRLRDVVQVTLYVTDLDKMGDINAVCGRYFYGGLPAQTVLEVAALPGEAEVAVSAIALAPPG